MGLKSVILLDKMTRPDTKSPLHTIKIDITTNSFEVGWIRYWHTPRHLQFTRVAYIVRITTDFLMNADGVKMVRDVCCKVVCFRPLIEIFIYNTRVDTALAH